MKKNKKYHMSSKNFTIFSFLLVFVFLGGCSLQNPELSQPDQDVGLEKPAQSQPEQNSRKAKTLSELDLDDSKYCYNTKMGRKSYKGTMGKSCICEGELIQTYQSADEEGNIVIYKECPEGMSCDSSVVYCQGEITGVEP